MFKNRIYCLLRPCFIRLSIIGCFSLFLINSYAQGNGPVAHYPFNGNANDESGNGNDGTVNGATLTTDRFGNENSAYSFDGIDDYIQIAHHDDLNGPSEITLYAWIKTNTHPGTVLSKGGPGNDWEYVLRIWAGSPNFMAYQPDQSVFMGSTTGLTVADNNWHNIVGTISSDEQFQLYIDNILKISASGGDGTWHKATQDLWIGSQNDN